MATRFQQRALRALARHWRRVLVTLLPLVFALLHATGGLRLDVLQRLDDVIYDARLRAVMPNSLDERIVIVDIDEKSLAEVGRWPWGRDKMTMLVQALLHQQKVAQIGFDVVFAEADESSGLKRLRQLASLELRDQPGFLAKLQQLQGELDYDARFASALQGQPVVLGYYFTSDRDGRRSGVLPAPVLDAQTLKGRTMGATVWDGFGANLEVIARAAPVAGYFNSITDYDGVVRSIPLLAEFDGRYYESLALAMFRMLTGMPQVRPGYPSDAFGNTDYPGIESVILEQDQRSLNIPVDRRVAVLVPFRGPGNVNGGSFRYISAADVLAQRLPAGSLQGRIVLVGTTAPGLLDVRVTPVGETYPGVETHANVLSGLLEGKIFYKPDYALGYEVLSVTLTGLLLALVLPLVSATRAVLLSTAVVAALVASNFWAYLQLGLVLPLATALVMAVTAFALNMSYGYLVESRSKRELANLFGTYVPPELVNEMVKDPDSYSMTATNRDLTVMFCDMRGFTKLSETMEPTALQTLLNNVFSRLTQRIRDNRGTIDKYMGDCVMAFWGAPVELADHAGLAVKTALEMTLAVRQVNADHRARGVPEIGVGIGLNTGNMCVGDMGSNIRRSYTVIGDAVNLGSRLEGLCKVYGSDIVVSQSTRELTTGFVWQELDKVRVKGKSQAVSIYRPIGLAAALSPEQTDELHLWELALAAYRAQQWQQAEMHLLGLQKRFPDKPLYPLYAERVAALRLLPPAADWDGTTQFETK